MRLPEEFQEVGASLAQDPFQPLIDSGNHARLSQTALLTASLLHDQICDHLICDHRRIPGQEPSECWIPASRRLEPVFLPMNLACFWTSFPLARRNTSIWLPLNRPDWRRPADLTPARSLHGNMKRPNGTDS